MPKQRGRPKKSVDIEVAIIRARSLWRHFRRDCTPRSMAEGIIEAILLPDGEKRQVLLKGFEGLVSKAATSQWVYDELIRAADDLMTGDHSLLVPDWLKPFAADVHHGRRPRPTRRGPRRDEGRIFRDEKIGTIVDIVSRNFCVGVYYAGKMEPTAASIVAEALRRERQKISEDAVVRSWKRYRR